VWNEDGISLTLEVILRFGELIGFTVSVSRDCRKYGSVFPLENASLRKQKVALEKTVDERTRELQLAKKEQNNQKNSNSSFLLT